VLTAQRAEAAANRSEHDLFHPGVVDFGTHRKLGYDNGPDAYRHTYGAALIVYRLMRERGASAEDAGTFLDGAGNAHERDSWLHAYSQAHGRYSSEMDVTNNILGRGIGATLAAQHAAQGVDELTGEAELRRAVIEAIGAGRTKVMDRFDAPPRASTWHDIAQVDAAGRVRRDASGAPILRTDVPDAPGFPAPLRDGQVDLSLPYARLGPAELRIPREGGAPQA
jgi:hypothetical protein